MPISVAIVGAGPAGFYTADALLRLDADVQVDIIERLPAPYGLIRYGVAPDHQTTKNITRVYAKTAQKEEVRYYGNVEIGRDLTLDELRGLYDAVVLSVGAMSDRMPNIPGADKKGVYGSAEFVAWYNGHPDFRDLNPDLNVAGAAVIGIGNVAVDITRLLVRSKEGRAKTDLPDYALDAMNNSAITDAYMFGRRGPVEAKFTNVELRELGELDECTPIVRSEQLPDEVTGVEDERDKRLREKNLATLKEFTEMDPAGKPKKLHIEFFASPVEVLGGDTVEGLKLERTEVVDGRAVGTGEFFEVPCGLVVAATGYRSDPVDGAPFDDDWGIIVNDDGRVADGLYVAGWIKRGPSGVISSNRPDGQAVAAHIEEDITEAAKPGRSAFEALLRERSARPVSFAEWLKIEEAEDNNATDPAPRRKFTSVEDMLAVLD